ncbi:lantibiotic dehydratase [Kutzneria sp. CA-103260]|uniref:lantibiotic dehydratase n=1 Tax=Kutzneria sp. CA-103260 TaxID=2802641 RepID=UPI001BEFE3FB|nr:lantibiotic dehydratase [Kutzneria sp. CA-103260]QUQ64540.1 lantibiotic dehydratase [Kutzneria sp. CA-103260]
MPGENVLLPGGRWRLWSQFSLRGTGFPAAGVLRLAPRGLAELAAELGQDPKLDGQRWQRFEERYDAEALAWTRDLQTVAASPAFRSAVAWQNRTVLETAVAPFLRWDPATAKRASMVRQRAELVAHYWQRFCVKNDTIGFFGPVGWGAWDDGVEGLATEPGTGLVATTEVYFSSWAVDAVARSLDADPELRPWIAPRRVPYLRLGRGSVTMPGLRAQATDEVQAQLLELCDGTRPVGVLAREASGKLGRELTEADVTEVLEGMRRARWIVWRLEVPAGAHPERQLRAVLDRVGDPEVRDRALQRLQILEDGRHRLREVYGDADRLVEAMAALEEDFAALTRTAAQREKGGRTAPCRSVVYSDCRRSATVRLGTGLVDELTPLALCLTAARWMTSRYADVVGARIREVYERLRERNGQVDLASLWFATLPAPHPDAVADAEQVQSELRERWARIVDAPPSARRVRLRSADIAEKVRDEFGEPAPAWWMARYYSPDVLIVAKDENAVARGEYELVLGELHCAMNTVAQSLFAMQHKDIRELFAETTQDFPGPRLTPMLPNELPHRGSVRNRQALMRDQDYYVAFVDHTIDPLRPRTVMSADIQVEDRDGQLTAVLPDGSEFDLLHAYGHALTNQVMDKFTVRPDADHSPRITVDRMTMARETWRFAAGDEDLGFAEEKIEARRFVRAGQWRRRHGLPRFVFVVSPAEPRPYYVDFDSPVYVAIFAKSLRRLARRDPSAKVRISEMLPDPTQTWLTDAEGSRYTAELRFVAVAQEGEGA